MRETKQVFSIDKPGAYKLRGGGIADILGVNDKYAFGWCRADKNPGPMRQWARKDGLAWAATPMMDIIEAIPFVVDGPGRYMMRDGRVAIVDQMDRQNSVSGQRIGGWYKSTADSQKTDTSWHVDGAWYAIKGIDNNRDLVRKMHPLEQEPGAKASEEQKAPETKKEPKKPTVAIKQSGKYRMRNGLIAIITHASDSGALGFIDEDVENDITSWLPNGRCSKHCESGEDIVEKIEMSAYEGASGKWTKEERDLLGAAAVEPKNRSAGFDLVIIRLNEQKCMLVVGDYENDDGDVKVRPIDDLDPVYVQRKCPDAIILKGDSYVMCPDTSISCVVHYGGEE